MKVLIIGAGALGKSLAALLMEHNKVMMYERDLTTQKQLIKKGFVFKEADRQRSVKPQVVSSLKELQEQDIEILIFATKIMDLKAAAKQAAGIKARYVFLPQNGLFDCAWMNRIFKTASICRGVTTMACQEQESDQVNLFYRGSMYIGGPSAARIAKLFRHSNVSAKSFADPSGCLWAKLIFSSVMNPLPVITAQGYGILKEDKQVWVMVKEAIQEGKLVAKTLGIKLAFEPLKLINRVRDGDLQRITHRGTIAQDISAGRSTELDFITGALVKQARNLKIKVPALEKILFQAKAAGA